MTRKLARLLLQTMVLSPGSHCAFACAGHLEAGWGPLTSMLLQAAGLCHLLGEVFGKEITCAGISAVCKALGRWEEL